MISSAHRRLIPVAIFFLTRLGVGGVLLLASARLLPVSGFATFSQLALFTAYLAMVATGGTTNRLIQGTAALGNDVDARRRLLQSALAIWAITAVAICLAAVLLHGPISKLLVGSRDVAWVVPIIAVFAVLGGIGQILSAVLTGRGAVGTSMYAQSSGIVAGGIMALVVLFTGNAAVAALAFAAGPLLTTVIALIAAHRELVRPRRMSDVLGGMVEHLHYAGAFFTVSIIPPLILFFLRSDYSHAFGLTALGLWLAANRISDISTQALGIYLQQVFLPGLSVLREEAQRLQYIFRTLLVATAAFGTLALVYAAAPVQFASLILSRQMSAAAPFILGYLIGDALRASTSIAMMWALAAGRPVTYAGIELTAWTVAAVAIKILISRGVTQAPYLGYVGIHATAAILLLSFILYRKRRLRSSRQ